MEQQSIDSRLTPLSQNENREERKKISFISSGKHELPLESKDVLKNSESEPIDMEKILDNQSSRMTESEMRMMELENAQEY